MELVSIDKLSLTLDEEDIENIKRLKEYAVIRDGILSLKIEFPILVDEDYTIIDGRKRFLAYKELGYKKVPITHSYDEIKEYIWDLIKKRPQLKREIIHFIRKHNLSFRAASRIFSISKSALHSWAQKLGSLELIPLDLLNYVGKEVSISELCKQFSIDTQELLQLLNQLEDYGVGYSIDNDKIYLQGPHLSDDWLDYLKTPRTIQELEEHFKQDRTIIPSLIEAKRKEGWDIRKGYINNTLVYFYGGTFTRTDLPIFHNTIELPLAIISDTHIGSKWFDQSALEQAMNMIAEEGIGDILMPGDILQGVNVYSREILDLSVPNISEQIQLASDIFVSLLPENVSLHIIMGNHEDAVKSKSKFNLDPIILLLDKIRANRPDITVNYYGHDAKLVIRNLVKEVELLLNRNNPQYVSLESPYTLYMIHGAGRGAYAISYPGQKIARTLQIETDILVIGHYHKLANFKSENKIIIMSGAFQGRNHFFSSHGTESQKGFVIIKGLDPIEDKHGTAYRKPLINLIPFD